MRILALLAALLSIAAATPSAAAELATGVSMLKAPPAALRSDRAYILFRAPFPIKDSLPVVPVFVRTPTEAEQSAYLQARQAAFEKDRPGLARSAAAQSPPATPRVEDYPFKYTAVKNAFPVPINDFLGPYDKASGEWTYLIEAPAGEYVFYGAVMLFYPLYRCNCFGTVKFQAAAGVVTDLGTVQGEWAGPKKSLQRLAKEPGGELTASTAFFGSVAQALVPPRDGDSLPPALAPLPRRPAEFHAVGPFVEKGALSAGRLAPVPGVLDYDGGQVVDVRTGQRLP